MIHVIMRKNDARQLDHKTLEELRMRVVKRVQGGESPEVMAKVLDLDRSTVYGWLSQYRQGGWDGLKAKPLADAHRNSTAKRCNGFTILSHRRTRCK